MSPDCQKAIDEHEKRISAVERQQASQAKKLDDMSRDILAIRTENNKSYDSIQASLERQNSQIISLTQQTAEHTGALLERNRIEQERVTVEKMRVITEEQKLVKLKWYGIIIGIIAGLCGMIGGTLLSSATWDNYFFGNIAFLHNRHTGQ